MNSFFDAAKNAQLNAEGELYGDEKTDIRNTLYAFVKDYPMQSVVPVMQLAPLSPWSGSNLFGHLQPFCI